MSRQYSTQDIEALLNILGIPDVTPIPDKAADVIIAAIFLSEGMDLTFEIFKDKKEAIETIMDALERVGMRHGIRLETKNTLTPVH